MTDQEIIDLYWKREETAIAVSANKFGSYCHSISYNILHDNEDAEECVNDTWLGAWKSMPPHRPERLSTFLGKITRNLSLNRFKKYAAEKRGYGQTELVLSELEDCIPDNTNIEQIVDDHILVQALNDFLLRPAGAKAKYLHSALLVSLSDQRYSSRLWHKRKQSCVPTVPYAKQFEDTL